MKNQPIGFMDSGVGGFSVVKEVMSLLPNEQLYFIGDSARNPYGSRPTEEVIEFSRELANFLLKKEIKLLVIACNTATAAALDVLQKEIDIPVIGVIEPGSKSAVEITKNNTVGVIATEGTVKSGEYNKKIKNINPSIKIQSIACQPFVKIVEENDLSSDEITKVVAESLKDFNPFQMDTLVLGCTHFPLLESYIQDYFGEDLILVNPAVETAKVVQKYLAEKNLQNDYQNQTKEHVFYTTGSAEKFEKIATSWLDLENKNFRVESLSLKELINK